MNTNIVEIIKRDWRKNAFKFNFFEESPLLVLFKSSLIILAVGFVLKPLIIDKILDVDGFGFLNKYDAITFYSVSVILVSGLFGYIHYNIKVAFLSTIDITVIVLLSFLSFTNYHNLVLYPLFTSPKYLLLILVGWILGSFTFYFPLRASLSIIRICIIYVINKLSVYIKYIEEKPYHSLSNRKGSIILDLSIAELALHEGETVLALDKKGLNFGHLAQNIVSACEDISSSKSVSIGINGEWGSGKSSLIDLIKYLINDRKSDVEIKILTFQPWIYEDQTNLMSNFFKLWKSSIDDLRVQMAFEDYAQYLTGFQFSSSKWDIFNLFRNKDSLKKTKDTIVNYLAKNPHKKYLVIIDDLDRIEMSEVLEVAKLTRVVADFPNTIYLLGYDRDYINSLLSDKKLSNKGSDFFDKIVSVEFKVPKADSETIRKQIILLLELNIEIISRNEPNFSVNSLIEWVDNLESDLAYHVYMPTIRDVKRFLNGLFLRYTAISKVNKVSFRNVFVFELFFYANIEAYNSANNNRNGLIDLLSFGKENSTKISGDVRKLEDTLIYNSAHTLAPYNVKRLVNTYFAYLDNISYDNFDTQYILNVANISDGVMQFVEDGLAEKLLIKITEQYLSLPPLQLYSNWEREGKLRVIEELEKALSTSKYRLGDDEIHAFTEVLFNFYINVKRNLPKGSSTGHDAINRVAESALKFKYNFPLHSFELDNSKISFTTAPYTFAKDVYDDKDDTTYNKIFHLNESETLSYKFLVPEIKHWRFGFKLSETNQFPIITTERTPLGYRLFHIGLDTKRKNGQMYKEDIRATYYVEESEVEADVIHDISFIPEKNIEISVSKSKIGIHVRIDSDDEFVTSLVLEQTQNINFIKLYAWSDNRPENKGMPLELAVETFLKKNPPNKAMAKLVKSKTA